MTDFTDFKVYCPVCKSIEKIDIKKTSLSQDPVHNFPETDYETYEKEVSLALECGCVFDIGWYETENKGKVEKPDFEKVPAYLTETNKGKDKLNKDYILNLSHIL